MEVAQLAHLVVLLVGILKEEGFLEVGSGDDPGRQELVKEIQSLTQVYTERTRAQVKFATSRRGQAALTRVKETPRTELQESANADPA